MTNPCNRMRGFGLARRLGLTTIALVLLASPQAFAGAHRPDFVAACENGHSYPIRAIAVSDQGELVTGDLFTGRHRAAHIRLIPVGFGYRYAASGLWLDGWRSDADLNFGKHRSIACTVVSD